VAVYAGAVLLAVPKDKKRPEVDPFTVEQASAHTVTIGPKKFAAVDEPRNRKYIGANLFRATVVGHARDGSAAADFPQRQSRLLCNRSC